ncbi:hypothetical protein [Parabacteroides sp.]
MKTTAEYISILRDYVAKNAGKYHITRMGIFGCDVDIVRLRKHMDAFQRSRIEKEGIYVG